MGVHFDGEEHQVVALAGTSVRLHSRSGAAQVVLLTFLLTAADFDLVDGPAMPAVEPFELLDSLPDEVAERARWWQRHVVEVMTGLPPGAGMGYGPYYEPDQTLPDTRAQTLDGTLSPNLKQREATHLRRAVREFAKNNLLVAAWNLPPLNVREIRKPDIPPQLVDVPAANLAELWGLHDHDSRSDTEETRPIEQDLSADPTGTARPDIDESRPVQA